MTIGVGVQVRCGVRQGGVLSPFLFAIYTDDIIVQMRKSGFGIRIGSIFAGCLLYADDIVLISCSYYGLQQEGQHPLTGQRAANFRRDLEVT